MKDQFCRLVISCSIFALLSCGSAYAAYPDVVEPAAPIAPTSSIYIGGDFGWGRLNIVDGTRVEPTIITNGVITNPATAGNLVRLFRRSLMGAAGRLNVGYNFNSYLALELGGNAWEEGKYGWQVYNNNASLYNVAPNQRTGISRNYNVDLLAKVSVPFDNGFVIYGKAGPAYIWSFNNPEFALSTQAPITYGIVKGHTHALRPEAAGAIGYNLDQYWSIHLQYLYLWGKNSNSLNANYIADSQQLTVGVQYNFV